MKWYKYWKIYLAIGIFFALSVIFNLASLRPSIIINVILTAAFLYIGLHGKKLTGTDADLINEINHKKWEKLPPSEKYKDLKKIKTSIVGVTFNNDDGSSRQNILQVLKNNDQLFLKEYTYNGSPAYYVLNKRGGCLGNLPQNIADLIKDKYDQREKLIFASRCFSFDSNEYEDEYDNKKEPNIVYGCDIDIYIK